MTQMHFDKSNKFFTDFCVMQASEEKNLFEKFKSFYSCFSRFARSLPPVGFEKSLTQDDFEKTELYFINCRELYDKWRVSGSDFNIWELAGIGRSEIACVRILAWFLDCKAAHGQNGAFLESLLELIPDNYWKNGDRPYKLDNYATKLESCYHAQGRRPDVEIRGNNFFLFIEAKVDSGEREGQLNDYEQIARNATLRRPYALVYLTLAGEESPNCRQACPISWKDTAAAFRKTLEKQKTLYPLSPAQIVCEHYCDYIENL